MEIQALAILLAVGVVSGFLAGFFGVGGGIVLVPILLAFLQSADVSSLVATHLTFGTSLLVVGLTSIASGYEYWRNNQIIWRAVLFVGSASVVGALIGSAIAGGLQGKSLQKIFAVVLVFAALRLLTEQRKPKGEGKSVPPAPALLLTGLLTGMVSALAGVGGGILTIPVMYSIFRFPLKKALGTSSATIIITAFAATAGYIVRGWGNPLLPPLTIGYVSYLYALPLAAASIPLARFGASVANRTRSALLKKIFSVLLLVIAIKMFFF